MATKRKTTAETPRIPDALKVEKTLFKKKLEERIDLGKNLLNRSITLNQLEKLKTDFSKWNDYNSEYLKQSFNNEDNEYKHDYDHVNDYIDISSCILSSGRSDSSQEKYEILQKISNKINNLEKLVEKVDLLKLESEQPAIKESVFSVIDNNNIFIVHGHNTAAKQAVARVIEKLGLNPIILHEQANGGKTIIEKFEKHSDVGFAIILMTDDDEGKAKTENNLRNRARQNVILELGYFIGKLGRKHVLPLHLNSVELPSDIHGLLYTSIDMSDTSESWKFAIVRELKAVGYNVDANKLI